MSTRDGEPWPLPDSNREVSCETEDFKSPAFAISPRGQLTVRILFRSGALSSAALSALLAHIEIPHRYLSARAGLTHTVDPQ